MKLTIGIGATDGMLDKPAIEDAALLQIINDHLATLPALKEHPCWVYSLQPSNLAPCNWRIGGFAKIRGARVDTGMLLAQVAGVVASYYDVAWDSAASH